MTCRRIVSLLLALSLGLTLLAPARPALARAVAAALSPDPQPALPPTGFRPPALELTHLRGNRLPRGATAQALPARFDWRELGKVTPVKDQLACNSCYAFATVANFESRLLVAGDGAYDLSENNAKECNWPARNGNYGGQGSCSGGDGLMVANLWSQQGTVQESCDPYLDWEAPCNTTCAPVKTVLDWRLLSGDVVPSTDVLKWYIQNYGPLQTAMYAGDGDPWQTEVAYYTGLYTLYHPGTEPPNHSVLLVGWDDNLVHDGGTGGWIVKNSWGSYWGGSCGYGTQGGYFTIAYGSASIGQYSSFVREWQDHDPAAELLHYDEAGWNQSLGFGGSTTAWGLARFAPPDNTWLTRVEFWTTDATTDVDVYVYDNFDGNAPRNLLWSALNLSYDEAGYHSVALTSPLWITAGDEVVAVVKFTNSSHPSPLGVDGTSAHEIERTYVSASGSDGSWSDAGQAAADVAIRLRTSRSGGQTEPGTLGNPLPIACGQTVNDDTTTYPSLISE